MNLQSSVFFQALSAEASRRLSATVQQPRKTHQVSRNAALERNLWTQVEASILGKPKMPSMSKNYALSKPQSMKTLTCLVVCVHALAPTRSQILKLRTACRFPSSPPTLSTFEISKLSKFQTLKLLWAFRVLDSRVQSAEAKPKKAPTPHRDLSSYCGHSQAAKMELPVSSSFRSLSHRSTLERT